MSENIETLKEIPIFKRIKDETLEKLKRNICITKMAYKKNLTILNQGEKYTDLHVIVKGVCYGEMLDQTGKAIIVEYMHAPRVIASAVLFSEKNLLPVSVITKEDSLIYKVERNCLIDIMQKDKEVLSNVMKEISNKAIFLSKRLSFMSFRSIKSKLANYLLSLPLKKDGSVILPMTVEKLSDYFGVLRPSLSRTIKALETEGLIKNAGGRFMILDKEGLIECASD